MGLQTGFQCKCAIPGSTRISIIVIRWSRCEFGSI